MLDIDAVGVVLGGGIGGIDPSEGKDGVLAAQYEGAKA
jgi:hypothetical protein